MNTPFWCPPKSRSENLNVRVFWLWAKFSSRHWLTSPSNGFSSPRLWTGTPLMSSPVTIGRWFPVSFPAIPSMTIIPSSDPKAIRPSASLTAFRSVKVLRSLLSKNMRLCSSPFGRSTNDIPFSVPMQILWFLSSAMSCTMSLARPSFVLSCV